MTSLRAAPSRQQQLQAVLLAALCSILFLGDGLLPTRALVPYPPELQGIYRAEAVAAGEYDATEVERGKLCMGDKYGQSLAWDRILQDRLRAGEIPLWTKDIAGGISFVPQMAQVWQPWNLLLLAIPSTQWYGIAVFLHQVLIGWFAYRFFRRIGCAHESALLGLVAAVIGLWTQSKLHHNVVLTAALAFFPMLSAIHDLARGGGRRSIARLALWTGLGWMSGFVVVSLQATYLAAGFALLLCLGNPRGLRLRPLLLCGLGMGLGGLLSLAHVVPVLLAAGETARPTLTPDELAGRALEWDYLLTLCWPDLFHWAADWIHPQPVIARPAWAMLWCFEKPADMTGFNWVECSFAVGLPASAAALLSFGERARRGLVLFFGLAAVFAFGLATATFPAFQLGRLLPGLSVSDVKRNLFSVSMCLSVLAALGADRLLLGRAPRAAAWFLAVVCSLSAIASVWLFTAGVQDITDLTARLLAMDRGDQRIAAIPGDAYPVVLGWIRSVSLPDEPLANLLALRATFLRATLIAGAALAGLQFLHGKPRLWVMTGLCMLELLHVGRGPAVAVAPERVSKPPAVVAPVLAAVSEAQGLRPRFQRLAAPETLNAFDIYPPNLAGFHHIEDLAAYCPLPPARMVQMLRAIEPEAPDKDRAGFQSAGVTWFRRPESLAHPLCDLLGIRFVLANRRVELPGIVERTPAGTPPPYRLYERTTCLPRATFVTGVEILPGTERRLAEMGRRDRDPSRLVILEDPDAPRPALVAANASVEILEHRDERVRIRVHSDVPGYLRLADPYDPGWTATVDGEPSPVYAADHYLRAVYLRPGRHEVVFAFAAPRVVWPPRISGVVLLLLLAMLLFSGRRPRAARRGRAG